ncbi:hypothetical protein A3F55_02735 [Candidatus Adlerbacteria bacterium RIFCSPHIGHO2_12_FULL_53_18]|uniref:Uncharacterized protein n=2 Tax=Parcubacteria group TaxID=1794811 RepID=A0A1F4XT82_9BACT|nr:MAG: hypothetical protein A3F55_02735 [Candidatus Adlerbacteria bacterium RIFCSPHIGHO2_12_FULL_53_18]OGG49105.1 MAG: hypothetical protein A2704_00415 [Candidatus Kaiserbacteria bacterium RIFCSPHIGHO2_01_FULL_54_36b]
MPQRDFKTNQTSEHVFWRFFLALVTAGVLLFVSSASVKAAWGMYQTFDMAVGERALAEAELAATKEEYVTIVATLEQFSSERGIEAAVRERFGVVRPGEGEIRIVRTESAESIEEITANNPFSKLFNALLAW